MWRTAISRQLTGIGAGQPSTKHVAAIGVRRLLAAAGCAEVEKQPGTELGAGGRSGQFINRQRHAKNEGIDLEAVG